MRDHVRIDVQRHLAGEVGRRAVEHMLESPRGDRADTARGRKLQSHTASPLLRFGRTGPVDVYKRQAIARALVRHPEILLFDDSFSALDTTTDFNLRTALKKDAATSAKIVIAQRVSSIADAERIVVLDEGRVVGVGSHAELLENCPEYGKIVQSQES